jgi:hypothetical protein
MLSIRRKVKPVPLATKDSRNETLHPCFFKTPNARANFFNKNSDFHFPGERSISQAEWTKAPAQRPKNQPQDTGIQCSKFDDPNLLA